jgi:hypothetical protein
LVVSPGFLRCGTLFFPRVRGRSFFSTIDNILKELDLPKNTRVNLVWEGGEPSFPDEI